MPVTANEPDEDLMVFCEGKLYAQQFTGYAPLIYGGALCLLIFGFVFLNSAEVVAGLLILAGSAILFYGLYRSSTLPKLTWKLQRRNGQFEFVYERRGISETATYPFPYHFGYRQIHVHKGIHQNHLYFTFRKNETQPEITLIKQCSPLEDFPADWPEQGEMAGQANIYVNSNGINLNKFEIQKIDNVLRQLRERYNVVSGESQ